MRRFFSGIVLLFLTSIAWASTSAPVMGTAAAVTNKTDISLGFLSQVFGTVGNSLSGSSGQMLGMLMSKFNVGVMAAAGLWLCYTIFTMLPRLAMEGSLMGQNRNSLWLIIRICLGFAFMLPSPQTGYNIMQDIVMRVTVEGVSLADQTWSYGLDYIQKGGTLWRAPAINDTSKLAAANSSKIRGAAQSIYNAEYQMVSDNIQTSLRSAAENSNGVVNSDAAGSHRLYQIKEIDNVPWEYKAGACSEEMKKKDSEWAKGVDCSTTVFAFPGIGNPVLTKNNYKKARHGYLLSADILGSSSNQGGLKKAALSQMVYGLYPAARAAACAQSGAGANAAVCAGYANGANVTEDMGQAIYHSFANYLDAVVPLAHQSQTQAEAQAKSWISGAQTTGWANAGRYYWDLSQVQSKVGAASHLENYGPNTSHLGDKSAKDSPMTTNWKMAMTRAAQLLVNAYHAQASGGTAAMASSFSDSSEYVNDITDGAVWDSIKSAVKLFDGSNMGSDPILWLHALGTICLNIAGDVWFGTAVTLVSIMLVSLVCSGAGQVMQTVFAWLRPFFMAFAAAMFTAGLIDGYYVPMYPFMLFLFGIIGWLIAVVEAMVAAPLVAFGLTHPEGHDFLGEAKQGVMLLLGVFLRPVLMIVGLIAGMILSYVAFKVLIYTYSGFMSDLFYGQGGGAPNNQFINNVGAATSWQRALYQQAAAGPGSGIVYLVIFPMMLGIFTTLVAVITNQCFSVIYALPDYILRWIGGPAQSSAVSAGDMAKEVKGGMQESARSMGQAASQSSEAMQKSTDQFVAENKQKQKDAASKSVAL